MRIYCKNKPCVGLKNTILFNQTCVKKYDIFVGHSTQSTGQAGPGKEKKRVLCVSKCMYVYYNIIDL